MNVLTQLEKTKETLTMIVSKFEAYLNETTLSLLMNEMKGDQEYYRQILSSIRKLLVYCSDGIEGCNILLKSEQLSRKHGAKMLNRIYHKCIEEFYSPASEVWYEDSRAAYTGEYTIKWRDHAPESVRNMIDDVEKDFQIIRTELENYSSTEEEKTYNP